MASEGFNPKIWYGIHRGWRMRGSGSQAARTGKPPPFSSRPTDRFPRQTRFDAYWAGPPGVVGPRDGKPPEESVDPSPPLPDAPGPAGRVFGAKRDFAS